jgi:hypothetical protein
MQHERASLNARDRTLVQLRYAIFDDASGAAPSGTVVSISRNKAFPFCAALRIKATLSGVVTHLSNTARVHNNTAAGGAMFANCRHN